jgi:hypothetical protein
MPGLIDIIHSGGTGKVMTSPVTNPPRWMFEQLFDLAERSSKPSENSQKKQIGCQITYGRVSRYLGSL